MAKLTLPRRKSIVKTELLLGRILVTLRSGKQCSFRYEQLTPKQETKLRSIAAPLPQKREVKASKSRSASKPRKTFNYAAHIARMDTVPEPRFVNGEVRVF